MYINMFLAFFVKNPTIYELLSTYHAIIKRKVALFVFNILRHLIREDMS